jgi:uncharacterized membrane protein
MKTIGKPDKSESGCTAAPVRVARSLWNGIGAGTRKSEPNPRQGTGHSRKGRVVSAWEITLLTAAAVTLLNVVLNLKLPGVSQVNIRPQIVLLMVVGYIYGPLYGFLAGVVSNMATDAWMGHGFSYFTSWTIGNGLLGAMMGWLPRRGHRQIETISHLAKLVLAAILVNLAAFSYASLVMRATGDLALSPLIMRYFLIPAVLANAVCGVLFLPLIIFSFGQMKRTYPIKLALINYYLILTAFLAFGLLFRVGGAAPMTLAEVSAMPLADANRAAVSFSNWAFLLLMLLLGSFALSAWMAKRVVAPLENLSESVVDILRGHAPSLDRLSGLARREDEVGMAGFAVKLLGERLLDMQHTAQRSLETDLKVLDSTDSGSDLFTVALVVIFGHERLQEIRDAEHRTDEAHTLISASELALSLCGFRELAATYAVDQIERSLSDVEGVAAIDRLGSAERRTLAVSLDTGLLFKGHLKVLDPRAPLTRELAFHLTDRCRALQGSPKNYVGFVTEPDILGRMTDAWERMSPVRNEHLQGCLDHAMRQQLVTGYILKRKSTLSRFDPELRIAYSHNSVSHLKQLIGLLRGEHLQAKLQFEPVHTSFYFRAEWDETPDVYLVRQENGDAIARKDECELVMEFGSREERDRFHLLIDAHAKRTIGGEGQMLRDSWFQPLFWSATALPEYMPAARLSLETDDTVAYCFVRQSDAPALQSGMQAICTDLPVQCNPVWVNPAFARYLDGESD